MAFPGRYFPPRYYPDRYFPQVGAVLPATLVPTPPPASWETVSNALAVQLNQIEGLCNVHLGDRHIRDEDRLRQLFGAEQDDPNDRDRICGAIVSRESIEEEWFTQSRTLAVEKWMVRIYLNWQDRDGTERRFQELLDRVWTHFRTVKAIADLEDWCYRTTNIQFAQFGDRLCHQADVEFEARALLNIPTLTQPTVQKAVLDAREDYPDIIEQLVEQVNTADGPARVQHERVRAITKDEVLNTMGAQVDGQDRQQIRTWRLYRETDTETRGIGMRVTTETPIKIEGFHSWVDTNDSAYKFQQTIEDMRFQFRGFGQLGNRVNPTATLQTPLQVSEIGARTLGDSFLTHFADCTVGIEETVHV